MYMMGERVKYLRKIRGLTQQQLAEMTQLSQSYISAIEQGDKIPTLYTLDEIARVLGVESVELVAARELSPQSS
jgi:transcriptional regulator with XRE-family HTH domain